MSDLGSKAALNSDIDAKVTTNGANENTGARVNDCLNNIVDTIYGSGAAPTATFSTTTNTAQDPGQDTFRFNNGTIGSVTEIALSDVVGGVDKGDLNSRFSGIIQFREVGTTTTVEFQITGVVHTSWTRYTVTYLKGALPDNGTVCAVRFIPSNNVATTRRNGAVVTGLVTDRYEGTTDVDGHLQFDLSAYTSIKLTGGGGNDRALIATPDDSTPATYRIAFTEDTGDPANTRSAWFTIEAILV